VRRAGGGVDRGLREGEQREAMDLVAANPETTTMPRASQRKRPLEETPLVLGDVNGKTASTCMKSRRPVAFSCTRNMI
jgi:hypothetical protein